MPYNDLREFIDRLEKEGELVRVRAEVDPDLEIGAIVRKVFDKRGKAILFENIKGHQMPLICGAMDTFKRYALGVGSEPHPRAILKKNLEAVRKPIPPIMVDKAPCQEVVLTGDEVDLNRFPVPKWNSLDGGKYIGTLGLVIVKDPETGIRNVGMYREMIEGRNQMGLLATQQVGVILTKHRDRKKPMPVVTAIGVDPSLLAASCLRLALGYDEFAAAGALNGKPIPLVKCKTIDLEAPANAEIILEGEIPLDTSTWEVEGPFGEFSGYYGNVVDKLPTIQVKAVTMRRNAIFQGTLEGRPPSESTTLRTLGHTTGIWLRMEEARIPGFKEVWISDVGCANFVTIIGMDKQYYAGNARQAIMTHWGMTHVGKWTIVVDKDIDIFDPFQVMWAMGTRVQPHRDIIITSDRDPGTNLDPSIPPEIRPYPITRSSRIGIDATVEFKGFDYPPLINYSPELMKKIEGRWEEYGIK
ncbi:MAG: UbiD family decarboxylase, partial [Syntrophorhabdales bacterium]|jgi:UbiD family decarboxylase